MIGQGDASVVHILGSPRSGTTWLQRMLGSHPGIASPQETDLISAYAAPLYGAWGQQLPAPSEDWTVRRHRGLPAVFTQEEFDAHVRRFVDGVYAAVLDRKPDATVLLEKNPINSFHVNTILRLSPQARFVHLLRDGRDVAVSLMRVSAGWGRWWAPSHVADAATIWRRHVEAARTAAEASGAYMEVSYEDLRSPNGADHLRRVLGFCGVEASPRTARSLYAEHSIRSAGETSGGIVWGGEVSAHGITEPREPDGFVGHGAVGGWTHELSPQQRRLFDRVAGALLVELGYADDDSWARPANWRERAAAQFRPDWRVSTRGRSESRQLLARAAPGVSGRR